MLLALSVNALVLVNNPFYCFSEDPIRPQFAMFGTETAYAEIPIPKVINPIVSQCKPSRLWYLGRHGTRFPAAMEGDNLLSEVDTIAVDILQNYESSKTTLCPSDAELIRNWKFNYNFASNTSAEMVEAGWEELKYLSSRLQKAFPTLLPNHYSSEKYFFRHSPSPRTLSSAKIFAAGLFGSSENVNYEVGGLPDLYLLPFLNCPSWSKFKRNVPEAEAFVLGSNYQEMLQQVNSKLGFHGSDQLDANTIDKLITHCKYEQIYNPSGSSAFCSSFSIANHQVYEYYRDLKIYYTYGYGNPAYRTLYENMSCTMLQNLLKFLLSNDSADQKAKLWFGHDATLHFMFTSLGLFEDEIPLNSSNFRKQKTRKWKTSFLTPMAANLVIVRYE